MKTGFSDKRIYHINIYAIVIILLSLVYANSFAQKTKEKLQEDKQQIENDIAYSNKLLADTKKNKLISLNQLIILNNKINQREELIGDINSQILDIDGNLSSNFSQVTILVDHLKQLKQDYAKMIIFAYKNRNAFNRLMFLFASSDLNQAFLRLKYLQLYSRYRRKQADFIMKTAVTITDKITLLKNIRSEKSSLLKNQEDQKTLLAQEKEEKNSSVKKLLQKEKELVKSIKQQEKEAKKLQQSIEAVITDEINKATEKNKVTPITTTISTNTNNNVVVSTTSKELGLSDAEITLSNNFNSNKGKLPWPAEKGIIISTFGVHPHPVFSNISVKNNGIDISTEQGAQARAIFDGKVTGVISVPGSNKAVIVRHGEYLTVYSNLSEVSVKTGDAVKTKQNIGLIATDANESKTELHFEVWYGKTLTNPIDWLSPNN
jgi:septal ring factor EnvC (AmiA/AmiB activator)